MTTVPALVAVIGPVEPELLTAFAAHYRTLGIADFHLAFHFPKHAAPERTERLLATATALPGPAPLISTGAWHEHLHAELRDRLRAAAGPGWHLIADSDEFHTYPAPLPDVIDAAAEAGSLVVGGLLLDRVAADGTLAGWDPIGGLDAAFPLGGFLTGTLLRGDPRKVVLADARVDLALGSHRSPGRRPVGVRIPVHHFKWRAGVDADLRRRVEMHGSGAWSEKTPAIRTEASRLLEHLDTHGGRIDVAGAVPFCPVSLDHIPGWWEQGVDELLAAWRPPSADSPDLQTA